MSLYDYRESQQIAEHGFGFYGLLMALVRKADTVNMAKLEMAWPDVVQELRDRYNLPGGMYPREMYEYAQEKLHHG